MSLQSLLNIGELVSIKRRANVQFIFSASWYYRTVILKQHTCRSGGRKEI